MNALPEFLRVHDIITVMTFFPCLGALLLLLLPRLSVERVRWTALAASLGSLVFAVRILWGFDPAVSTIQFDVNREWIPSLNVHYHVGVDGLSLAMVLLVSIIIPLTILGAFKSVGLPEPDKAGLKPFYALILLEQTGLYGAFTALDFFHWFIFWEVSLVPMFFLIKLYGHEDRTHASYQFFIYTFVGSVAMLIGMQFIYLATGTWDFVQLANDARTLEIEGGDSVLAGKVRTLAATLGTSFLTRHSMTFLFVLVFLGFAVKVPLWPFHTWLPVTYTQAPTAGSMLLTGLMSKMGLYGFLRIVLPLFGDVIGRYLIILMALATITILFGALAALAQRDLKTLVAYSSVSHLGYCLLGIFVAAAISENVNDKALVLNGVIVQMFAHGLSAAGLFYFVGLLEQRAQTRALADLGGLRKTLPVMCGLMGIVLFASLGLPGLAGFVGEFMIFRGAFGLAIGLPGGIAPAWLTCPLGCAVLQSSLPIVIVCIAVVGILLTALYLLRLMGRVFFGPQDEKWNVLPDLTLRERMIAGVLVVLLFFVGLIPQPIIALSNSTVFDLVKSLI